MSAPRTPAPAAPGPLDDATLDALLALDRVPPPSDGLRRTILLDYDARRAGGFWHALWRELGGLRVAGPALAASLALGITVSTLVAPPTTDTGADAALDSLAAETAPEYTELALFDAAYEDYAL